MKRSHIIVFMAAALISSSVSHGEIPGSDARAEIIALDNAWVMAGAELNR